MFKLSSAPSALALLLLTGCPDPIPPTVGTGESLLELMTAKAELSTFVELVGVAGLSESLDSDRGIYTVLAPNNAAFSALPAGTLEALRADPGLSRTLLYHMFGGVRPTSLLGTAGVAQTLAGLRATIQFSLDGTTVVATGTGGSRARFLQADLPARNGLFHVVDGVLIPPEMTGPEGNVLEAAMNAGLDDFASTFGVSRAVGMLTGREPITAFAPTDEAFARASLPANPDLLENVLFHHLVIGAMDADAIVTMSPLSSLSNTTLTATSADGELSVNGVNVEQTIGASNGFLHVVDEVLLPPTVAEVVASDPNLGTLSTAVGASSAPVQATLSGAGPITLFAPNDPAFAALPPGALDALLADQAALDARLGYHVMAGQVLTSSLTAGMTLTMQSGGTVTVRSDATGLMLEDGAGGLHPLVQSNLRLLNGAVHIIGGVMNPQPMRGDLIEVATGAGNLNRFVSAVDRVGLTGMLQGAGPFTVLAPTDTAFNLFGDLTGVDPGVVQNLLLGHVIAERLTREDLRARAELLTAAGTRLPVVVDGNMISIRGASVGNVAPLDATNGALFRMTGVIVPPTVAQLISSTAGLTMLQTALSRTTTAAGALAPDVLAGAAPVTVFAPNNAAFMDADINPTLTPLGTIESVLRHHIVRSQILVGELTDGLVIPSDNGNITVAVSAQGVITLTGAQGTTATVLSSQSNVRGLTGTLHVIDAVLFP